MVLFIFGPQYSARKKDVHTMLNTVSGSAMLAIWLKHKNRAVSSVELEGLFKARRSVECLACYMIADNVLGFCKIWTIGTVLCSVGENGESTVSF